MDESVLGHFRFTHIVFSGLMAMILGAGMPALASSQSNSAAHSTHTKKSVHNKSLVLTSNIKILEAPNTPGPVHLAAEDLASDFEKVFGKKPAIATEENDSQPKVGGAKAEAVILIGENSSLPEPMRGSGLTAPESFSISIVTGNKTANENGKPTVVLAGADMRGTIYAIYEFSQKYLGVDPLYYWTDHQPIRRASIELPTSLHENYPAPVFKYRGFFVNDEDLLTGWAPGEKKDKTGISLAVWGKIYEATLRLKGNIVAPGTWIFPDDPQVKLAAKRGLIITQHHAIPLGLNVARWPKDVPYNSPASDADLHDRLTFVCASGAIAEVGASPSA